MTAPVLLFGVGAAKSGTSWLYRYLHDHPDCHLRAVKEVHYFDARESPAGLADQLRALAASRRLLEAHRGTATGWRAANLARQIATLDELEALLASGGDEAAYLGYLWSGAGDAAQLAADLTPGYSLLPVATLRQMAALPGARFVYLMRDPVARLWSHVRMQARRDPPPVDSGYPALKRARRMMNRIVRQGETNQVTRRGDYRGALERLDAAVPPAKLHVEFMERLMTEDGVGRLCAFLGIRPWPADFGRIEHEGAAMAIRPGQLRAARQWLAPQYEYVARRLGDLPTAWRAGQMERMDAAEAGVAARV